MYIFDTNVVFELRRPDKADRKVLTWAAGVPNAIVYLSVITILEVELGALSIARRDPAQGHILRAWIDGNILPRFAGRILPVDTEVARRCAGLHVPNPRAERDALIAATALTHKMTVVTRNLSDFVGMNAPTLNPWN